ncbi:SGNH/GDSL hydrolase family protein [Oceanobacillus massiliensis]|uniref:SGNH/GDSL hydrolase family protein n=1 Tax=Oceanobacillus massiliensis TaxID=1465765 RepID=UPI000287EB99|nr:SGNH/GDSL hydrolase family protein [Oceanobacillus massiliensis]
MQKKRLYIIASLLFLILCTAGIILYTTGQSDSNLTKTDSVPDDSTESERKESAENETETEEENVEQEQRTFPELITEAVQSTVDFFTNQETHIVAIGDSLTQGVGDETEQNGYVGILDRTINANQQIAQIDNYGKRGNRTDQLLLRLENNEIANDIRDSDIVLITIGANDIMKVAKDNITDLVMEDFVFERKGYEERMRQIFDEIRRLNPNTEIYLIGFYNPFEQYFQDIKELDLIVETWNAAGKAITDDYDNVTYIPTEDLFKDSTENLFSEDNFHPNYEGYYRIAERVLEYITIR